MHVLGVLQLSAGTNRVTLRSEGKHAVVGFPAVDN